MTDSQLLTDILARLGGLEMAVNNLHAEVHSLVDMPARVQRLEMAEARRGGMLAVVGVVAGLVASVVVAVLSRLAIWR